MKQCKPCITIKTIYHLAKIHWNNFRKDVKEWSKINKIACEITPAESNVVDKYVQYHIDAVRKLAQENYDPESFSREMDYIKPEENK